MGNAIFKSEFWFDDKPLYFWTIFVFSNFGDEILFWYDEFSFWRQNLYEGKIFILHSYRAPTLRNKIRLIFLFL